MRLGGGIHCVYTLAWEQFCIMHPVCIPAWWSSFARTVQLLASACVVFADSDCFTCSHAAAEASASTHKFALGYYQ